jgi:hypothetical protein
MIPRFRIDDIVSTGSFIGKIRVVHLITDSGNIEYTVDGIKDSRYSEDELSFYTGDAVTPSVRPPATRW